MSIWASAAADHVDQSGAVGGAHLDDGGARRRVGAYGDRGLQLDRRHPAQPLGGVDATVDDRLEPLAQQDVVEPGLGDVPDRDAEPVLGPRPGRPDRGLLQRQHRGRVGEQSDAVARDHGDPGAVRRRVGHHRDRPRVARAPARGSRSRRPRRRARARRTSAAAARRTSVRTREARHLVHAFSEVARASASVSAASSSSSSRSATLAVTSSTVAGSSGSRVVAVSGSSRCQRTRSPTSSTSRSSKPSRAAIVAGDRLTGDAVLGELALADVVQQRGDHQHVGAGHPADQRRRLDAGLHEVPVHGEAVHDRGVRQQPHPLPLREDPLEGAGLVEGLPDAEQAGAGGEQPHEQVARLDRPRVGQRRAPRGPAGRRSAAPAPGRARRPRRRRAAAAAGHSATLAPLSSTISSNEIATPGAIGLEPRATPTGRAGQALDRLGPSPGQPGEVRDPTRQTPGVHLYGGAVGQAEDAERSPPSTPAPPGRSPARRPRAGRRGRRAAPSGSAPGRRGVRRPASWPPAP